MRISDWSSDVCSSDLYWGAWPEAGDRLTQAILTDDNASIAGEYEANARHLAAICQKKYFYVAIAFRGLVGAVLCHIDRKSVVEGQSVSVRVDLGGRRIIKKKK